MKREDFYRLLLDQPTLKSVKEVVLHKSVHKEGLNLRNGSNDQQKMSSLLQDSLNKNKIPNAPSIQAEDISVLYPESFILNQR